MQTCLRCGTQSPDQTPYCPACGQAMQQAPQPQAAMAPKKTMLGVSPGAPGASQPAGKRTMLGMPDAGLPGPARQGVGNKTVLGMAMGPAAQQPQPHQPQPQQPPHQPLQQPAPIDKPQVSRGPIGPTGTLPPEISSKNRTMLGVAPADPRAAQRIGNKTMMGVPSPDYPMGSPLQASHVPQGAQVPQAHVPQAHVPQAAQVPQAHVPQAAQVPQAHVPQAAHVPPLQPSPADQLSKAKTMLGVAMPGIAPTHTAPAGTPSQHKTMLGVAMPGIAPTRDAGAPPGAVGAQPASQHRTMLGVAMPGIAPTHEPRPAQPEAPPYTMPEPPPPPAPYGTPDAVEPRRKRPVVVVVPIYRRLAFVLAMLGLSVILLVGLFALLWPTTPPISSQAMVNEQGKDILRLTCVTCPDGTVMTVEGVQAKVEGTIADITLPKPLQVGDNRFKVGIDRPESGRDETVELSMPVAFRVRPDLEALGEETPTFHVEVEAAPDTSILIDGTLVKQDAAGKARFPVDVSESCTGPSVEVATIDRKVSYTIQPKGGAPSSGAVTVKVGISPLTLQAPRPRTVVDTESFLVAGRSARGAAVDIEGATFDVSADGTFSRKMQIKRPEETKVRVRARLPDHAPRTVVFTVKRVTDLEAEAKAFEARASLDVRSLMDDVETHRGKEVVMRGEVVEARSQGFVRVILLDVAGKCAAPPCLARLVHAGPDALDKGNSIRVFGRVAGAHTTAGKSVPEIDVDFLLKGR